MNPRFIIASTPMNKWLEHELCVERDWDYHPRTVPIEEGDAEVSDLAADFRKARIEVEVQFGNIARYTYDVLKMAISMNARQVDVGVLVVPTRAFAQIIGENLAHYERVIRELARSHATVIVPLAVIGIEPEEWDAAKYPGEDSAPRVTTEIVNAARRRRGLAPVEEPPPQPETPSTEQIRRLFARVA